MGTNDAVREPDLLVVGHRVVTVDPAREVLVDAAVAVTDGRISAIGDAAELTARHPRAPVVGGPDAIVVPGYVNCHQHLTGDRLLRSAIPDDIEGHVAIFDWAVPAHAHHTGDDDEVTALAGLAEAVANGYTTTVEAGTVAHPDRVTAAARAVGARLTVGTWGWDVDDAPFAAPPDEVLARQEAVLDANPAGGLVTGWVTLVGHDLMSDELVTRASALAADRGVGLTFHISPSERDAASYLERHGVRPLVHLERLGALGPHVLLAHAVHLDDAEVAVLERTSAAVAYCPWAYLRLAGGVTGAGRHVEMLRRGIRVGLGCDAENAGDAIDPLRTAAVVAGLAKDVARDPAALTAHAVFEMSTIGGAAAIGMADEIGSIEVGKQADLVIHDGTRIELNPLADDVVNQLVWATDGRSVSDVIVAGRPVVADGVCTTIDAADLRDRLAAAAADHARRAGLPITPRWPLRSL
jgi:5-methylthioadenosine/S-adenosylhomocysteine deaminase